MANQPKPPGGAKTHVAQATPGPREGPTLPSSPDFESSDDTRLRPQNSFPDRLEAPAPLPPASAVDSHYDVGAEVARGGLGKILRAFDKRLNRVVALKLLRARDPNSELRFVREALITARLQHPAIVPVYEAGQTPDGEPFYAMKLLAGKSLAELIADRPTLAMRLALLPNVIAVADAIAYAHENRVIHRDLKPANIMVGSYGETLVIDWGLAKDLDANEPADTPAGPKPPTPLALSAETIAGAVLGTPAYMPPEQAQGDRADERADVYALGAVLYHLLGGKVPLSDLSPAEAVQRVMMGPLPDISRVVDGVPEDLAAIVRKAMAHAKEQRYPSARELSADLRRFELGQLVSVRSYFWWERLWRWTLKHRGVMAVASAAAIALVLGGVFSVTRIIEERNAALAARTQAEAARNDATRRRDELVLIQAVTALERDPTAALAWLKQHPGGEALARLRTIASDAVARGVARHVFRSHEARVSGLAFGASADELFSCGADGRMFSYDLRSGTAKALVEPPGVLWVMARSRDGKHIAVTGDGNRVRLWTSGAAERLLELDGTAVLALELSPDAKWLAAGTVNGKVFLWDVESGTRRELAKHTAEVRDLVFSPDGATLASTAWDGTVHLQALDSNQVKSIRAHTNEVWSIDFSPDGRLLATGGADGLVRLWDQSGAMFAELKGHTAQITWLRFSPDGTTLATASRDHTVRLWSAPFKQSRTLEGHTADVVRVAFSPDGKTLASTSLDGSIRVWSLTSPEVRVLGGHEALVSSLEFSPDGRLIATAGQDGSVRVWMVTGEGVSVAPPMKEVVLSPSGAAMAGIDSDGNLRAGAHVLEGSGWRFLEFVSEHRAVALDGNRDVITWEPNTGERHVLGRLPVDIGSAALASGWLAVGAYDGTVRLWRESDGLEKTWRAHKTYTLSLVATPDGKTLVSSGEEGLIKLWDVASGESRTLTGHVGPIHQLRLSPDGSLLASGDLSGEVRVWHLPDGALVASDKHRGFARTVAFSKDGNLVASSGDGKTVRVLELAKKQVTQVLTGPEGSVFDLDFSPDGALLAAAAADLTVRVFDWRSGAAHVLRGHRVGVGRVMFSPDGASLTSIDSSGAVRRWSGAELQPLPQTRESLEKWIEAATTARIDADHRPATATEGSRSH